MIGNYKKDENKDEINWGHQSWRPCQKCHEKMHDKRSNGEDESEREETKGNMPLETQTSAELSKTE